MKTFLCTVLTIIGLGASVLAYPTNTGLVTDAAGILTTSQKNALELQLRSFEQETSVELAVVTTPSLDGTDIDAYKNGLFKAWGVGKGNKDNGILIVIAPNEKKIGIEVGYGLEPILTDGWVGQMTRSQIVPAWRAGDRAGAIQAGVLAIMSKINEVRTKAPEAVITVTQTPTEDTSWPTGLWVVTGMFALGCVAVTWVWFRKPKDVVTPFVNDPDSDLQLYRTGTYNPVTTYPQERFTTPYIMPIIVPTHKTEQPKRTYDYDSVPTPPSSSYDSSSSSSSSYDSSSSSSSYDFGGGSSGGGGYSSDL